MNAFKKLTLACFIFLAGALAGGLLCSEIIHLRIQRAFMGGPEALTDLILGRLATSLQLDKNQRKDFRALALDCQKRLIKLHQKIDPEAEKIILQTETKARLILKPKQLTKFDRLVAERKMAWKNFEE